MSPAAIGGIILFNIRIIVVTTALFHAFRWWGAALMGGVFAFEVAQAWFDEKFAQERYGLERR